MNLSNSFVVFCAAMFFLISCNGKQPDEIKQDAIKPRVIHKKFDAKTLKNIVPPEWTKNALMYEVDIRHYSPEGTIKKVTNDLERLHKLGVDVLWIMPIQPIGKINRKGTLGSYYSIKDYITVNPDLGSLADFKQLVQKAHSYKMHVILDWVAAHTSSDHQWIKENTQRYKQDSLGHRPAIPNDKNQLDIAQLDYKEPTTRTAMEHAMRFWIKETNIDGFRCYTADQVPMDFWYKVRKNLEEIKPVFMVADTGLPIMYKAFDMTTDNSFYQTINLIAKGKISISQIPNYKYKQDSLVQKQALFTQYTTMYDDKTSDKLQINSFGSNHLLFATLSFTLDGMPTLFTAQEINTKKELPYFEKDTINWKEDNENIQKFYRKLTKIYTEQPAFWNGKYRSKTQFFESGHSQVLVYKKTPIHGKPVIVLMNFGDNNYELDLQKMEQFGIKQNYIELMGNYLPFANDRYQIPPHQIQLIQNK